MLCTIILQFYRLNDVFFEKVSWFIGWNWRFWGLLLRVTIEVSQYSQIINLNLVSFVKFDSQSRESNLRYLSHSFHINLTTTCGLGNSSNRPVFPPIWCISICLVSLLTFTSSFFFVLLQETTVNKDNSRHVTREYIHINLLMYTLRFF